MPLTPEDVRNKQFTTVRLREGYDEDEVDAFLDEVEAELTRLLRENDELRAKLAAATRAAAAGGGGPQQPPRRMPREEPPHPPHAPPHPPHPPQPPVPMPPPQHTAPQPPMALPGPPGHMPVPGQGPGGDSAARVLALAQQTADQAIAEARSEANKIVGEARAKADHLEREARHKAQSLERDAEDKHRHTMGSLETQRATLERKVDDLRAFEREYRSRLKSYLEGQLRQLEGHSDDVAPPRVPQPVGQAMSAAAQRPPGPPMPPHPQQLQQTPTPMRGFLIDEDPDS
ncbi:MAG: DivIVA domain-containing protein [Carbonactinosporaceae bacterium]